MTDPRAVGGQNNKAGNRFEDFYATHCALDSAASFFVDGSLTRFKEQAGCHVDDSTKPSQLAHLTGDQMSDWKSISAARNPGPVQREMLALAFYAGWIDCDLDAEGFRSVESIIEKARSLKGAEIFTRWDGSADSKWLKAQVVLRRIPRFNFWTDRGYFEWELPPADSGIFGPCTGEGFARFVERVLENEPTTFSQLEALLP